MSHAWMTAALLLAFPRLVGAQVRASEHGSISQIVDGTLIEVSYGRPRLRGRIAFGGVVHWGEMWTPGANWATTLRVSKPVRLNDHPVPAGSYSVWIVYEDSRLKGIIHDGARRFELFPTGVQHQFWFESHDATGPLDVEQDAPVVFAIDRSGRATGFSMKGIEQPLWMRGIRAKE